MTERHDTALEPPAAPYLITPRREAVVDGAAVTFEWDPVETAETYLLEIAADTAFETLLVSQIIDNATSYTLRDTFPPDGSTFFWRVIARNKAGESHGDVIESFVSGTAEDVDRQILPPAEIEHLGPVPELVVEGTRHVADGDFHGPDEVPPEKIAVQHEGIGVGAILGFIGVVIVFIAAAILVVFFWVRISTQDLHGDLALQATYPERRELDAAAAGQLTQYDIVDDAQGIYQIPIDRAIDLMVNEAYQQSAAYSSELPLRSGN